MAGGFLINSALRGVNDLREIRLLLLVCPLYKEQKMHFLASVYFLIYIYIYIYICTEKTYLFSKGDTTAHKSEPCSVLFSVRYLCKL